MTPCTQASDGLQLASVSGNISPPPGAPRERISTKYCPVRGRSGSPNGVAPRASERIATKFPADAASSAAPRSLGSCKCIAAGPSWGSCGLWAFGSTNLHLSYCFWRHAGFIDACKDPRGEGTWPRRAAASKPRLHRSPATFGLVLYASGSAAAWSARRCIKSVMSRRHSR